MIPISKLLLLVFSVIASGGLVLIFKWKNQKILKLLLAYSGAFIFALCLFHLLPDVYTGLNNPTQAGWLIVAGFLIQLLLDYISGGIEHGHMHTEGHHAHHDHDHKHDHHHEHPVMQRFPWMLMIGLCTHAFIEGIPLLFNQSGGDLYTAIIFHNIPISITLMTLFLISGKGVYNSLAALIIFALMTPAGAVVAYYLFPEGGAAADHFGLLALAFVIGIFLHISTTILFESDQNHRFNLLKLLTILLGIATVLIL
ncbi:MAG: ZIP family metal transporter [Bacteroidia bacterium]